MSIDKQNGENYIYSGIWGNNRTFSVNNGSLERVSLNDSKASPIIFADADDFVSDSSTENGFTQIDVDTLVEKFKADMTQDLLANKTAKVSDYRNRIYQIDISASSGYYVAVPDIHMEFVVDASRSMFFPSSLEVVDNLNGNNRTDISNWLSSNGDTGQTYFVIRNPNSAATVEAIYYYDNKWYHVDGSNYSPPDNKINKGSELSSWNVSNFDGKIYTTTFTGTKSTDYGNRKTWVSRIEYLQQAVKAAAEVIWAVNPDATLGLVSFNSSTRDCGTFEIDESEEFYEALKDISLAGGTNQRDGLNEAIHKFNEDSTKNQKQLVAVLVTDGAPNWKNDKNVTVEGKDAWNEIGSKATALKRIEDADGTAELYCMGLSLEHVGNNKSELFGISSGNNYNFNAEDAASIVDCVAQIVDNVMKEAALQGDVVDRIDPAFYPVEENGTPLSHLDWINLDGEKVEADSNDAAGQLTYNSGDDTWTVTWNNQLFDWPSMDADGNIEDQGWQGTVYVKAKENFLGGNNINTNLPESRISADKFVYYGGTTPLEKDIEEKTEDLPIPYVNVGELAFTNNNTAWTVYLGTKVDPWTQIEELLKTIDVRELVKSTVDEQHKVISVNTDMLSGTSDDSETFSLSDIIGQLEEDKKEDLKKGGTVNVPYDSSIASVYNHGKVGNISLKLTKNEHGNYDIHPTDAVGTPRETYTLTVTYTPASESARDTELSIAKTIKDPYHNGTGSKGPVTGNIESVNAHRINVFAKGFSITKKDQAFTHSLTGAEFVLYRTARETDESSSIKTFTLNGRAGSYYPLETLAVNNNGIASVNQLASLKENESYILVETKAPAGYTLLPDPIPITISITDSFTPVPSGGITSQETKPDNKPYNWSQTASLRLGVSSHVKRTDESGEQDLSYTAVQEDSLNGIVYYDIANDAGIELSNAGGIGTTIFYVVGTILVLGAGVLLVTKRCMTE